MAAPPMQAAGRSGDEVVVGLDLGTSSLKGLLLSVDGTQLHATRNAYPMHSPQPSWRENDAEDWWTATVCALQELAVVARDRGLRIRALGLVAQRDPFVLLDSDGAPVAPAISWTDQRTGTETAALRSEIGDARLLQITGVRPIIGQGVPALMWTRRHLPDRWAMARRAVSPKDFVLGRLLGGAHRWRATDPTTPTRSLGYDVEQRKWSTEILTVAGIGAELFDPPTAEPWEASGRVAAEVAADTGLPGDVVVAVGGADDQAATLGAGAVSAGEVCLGTGTCSGWRMVTDAHLPDPTGAADSYPHVVPGRHIREVTIDSTGSSLRWFASTLAASVGGYEQIVALAMTAPIGAAGVRFLPFVDGAQRAPHYLDNATGVFLGISGHHTLAHLSRAVLEGIAMMYPGTWDILRTGSADPVELTMVDAEAASTAWTQIKADVLGRSIRLPAVTSAAAMGAAVLATTAAGIHPSVVVAAGRMVHRGNLVEPIADRVAAYAELRTRYEDDVALLRPLLTGGGR